MTRTAAGSTVSATEGHERRSIRYHSLRALYRKEMADHVTSKRFIIILILVMLYMPNGLLGSRDKVKV